MKKAWNRLSVLALMLLGVLPQLAIAAESLELGVRPRLWLWIGGLALCLWICACFRRGILVGMPAAAALLYAAYRVMDANPLTELDDAADRFVGAYYLNYHSSGANYSYLNAAEDHSFLLLLAAFLLLAYLSSALTTRSGRKTMCFLGTVPLTAGCLAVNGTPSYIPAVAILLFWALVLISGNYDEEGPSGRIVLAGSLPILFLLALVLVASHPEDYRFDEHDAMLSQQFDRIGEWIRQWFDSESGEGPLSLPETSFTVPEQATPEAEPMLWESTDGGMDLTRSYAEEMLSCVFFRVQAQSGGTLYLRGLSYGDYLGTGWARAPEAPVSSLSFTASAVEDVGQKRTLAVETVTRLRYAVLPYYCAVRAAEDAGVPASAQSARQSYLVYAGSFSGIEASSDDELLYRAYAHEVYTRLPESTRLGMQEIAAQAGLDGSAPDAVARIAAYVRDSGVYDIETEPYPDGDHALYFFTHAHHGYCVHFATAATALYRALGIPARITEGFLITAEDGRRIDVKGEHAHAWVEIYRDGIGWIPVEVTGRSGLRPDIEQSDSPQGPEESAAPQETPTPQPDESSAAADAGTPLPVGIVRQEQSAGASKPQGKAALRKGLPALLLLLLAAAALPLWRLLIRLIWDLRFRAADPNRAAVALWRRSQQLRRFGAPVPVAIQNCAEKASFSARGISADELAPCLALFSQAAGKQYSALPPLKKLLFRYVYGLI